MLSLPDRIVNGEKNYNFVKLATLIQGSQFHGFILPLRDYIKAVDEVPADVLAAGRVRCWSGKSIDGKETTLGIAKYAEVVGNRAMDDLELKAFETPEHKTIEKEALEARINEIVEAINNASLEVESEQRTRTR